MDTTWVRRRRHLVAAIAGVLILMLPALNVAKPGKPGRTAYRNIALKKGYTATLEVNGQQISEITTIRTSARTDGGALIVLERPVSGEGFARWIVRSRFGKIGSSTVRTNGSIVVYDTQLSLVGRYTFVNGWPSEVTGARAGGTGVAMEMLRINAEGIELN